MVRITDEIQLLDGIKKKRLAFMGNFALKTWNKKMCQTEVNENRHRGRIFFQSKRK